MPTDQQNLKYVLTQVYKIEQIKITLTIMNCNIMLVSIKNI